MNTYILHTYLHLRPVTSQNIGAYPGLRRNNGFKTLRRLIYIVCRGINHITEAQRAFTTDMIKPSWGALHFSEALHLVNKLKTTAEGRIWRGLEMEQMHLDNKPFEGPNLGTKKHAQGVNSLRSEMRTAAVGSTKRYEKRAFTSNDCPAVQGDE